MCDDLWGIHAAHVVCRQLDCGEGISALGNGHFGEGTGSILLDNVQCLGNETTLGRCRHLGLSVHDCGHEEDAGVVCSGAHSWFLRRLQGAGAFSHPGIVPRLLHPYLCFGLIRKTFLFLERF